MRRASPAALAALLCLSLVVSDGGARADEAPDSAVKVEATLELAVPGMT